MTKALYDKGRNAHLRGEIAFQTDTIKFVLVDTGAYTLDLANHQYLSDIPSGARIAISGALASKTTTAGVADADDPVFTAVSGAVSEALVLFKDTGTPSTSALILYNDEATGLPVTPNGGDITVVLDSGSSKLYKL